MRGVAVNSLPSLPELSRLLFEKNPKPMWVYDRKTLAFVAVNEAAIRHYGYSADEFLSMTLGDIRPPEDLPALVRAITESPRGLTERGIWRHRRKDGSIIEVEITAHDFETEGRPLELIVAHDVTSQRRTEAALRRRVSEARSMLEVSWAVNGALDLDAVLNLIVERACLLLGTSRSGLAVVAPEESGFLLEFVAVRGLSTQFAQRVRPLHWRDGTTAAAVHERRPVSTPDILNDPTFELTPSIRQGIEAEGYRAALSVPLLANDQVLGALVVYRDEVGPFSEEEVDVLQMFAAQAAIALANARLFEEAERRRREAEVLAELTSTIGASLDIDTVLERVVQGAKDLCKSDVAFVALREPTTGEMLFRRHLGFRQPQPAFRVAPGSGCGGRVLATGASFRTDDCRSDPRLAGGEATEAAPEDLVAVVVVPIRNEQRIDGLLYVANRTLRSFSDRDEAVLRRLAEHVGVAVQNARLFEETERRRREAETLAGVGRLISQSLETQEVGRRIAESTQRLLGSRTAALYRRDPDSGNLALIAAGGTSVDQIELIPAGHGAAGLAVRQRRPVITTNILNDPRITLPAVVSKVLDTEDRRAVLAVPLFAQDTVVGVLTVTDREGRVFRDDEIRLVQVFADQAALALENARLYAELRTQLQQLESAQAQLLQAGKLAAVGQLIGGVAHELNNPLAVVVGHAQLLQHKVTDARVRDRADKILQAAQRAARIVKELQNFARPSEPHLSLVDLGGVVGRVIALREHALLVNGILVDRQIDPDVPPVLGDTAQLEQVTLNLLLNAEHACRSNGGRTITVSLTADGQHARVAVEDDGPGIPPDVLPRIFEPFFTTKPVGQGTGLGLSICYSIVSAHRGSIIAESSPAGGARLVIELPVHDRAAAAVRPPAILPPPAVPAAHVLVIDDERDVADTLRALLEDLGQKVTVATSGEAGWRRLTAPEAAYDVVTLDLKMPDLSGQKLWERLVNGGNPFTQRIVFVTGDTVEPETQEFLRSAGRPVIDKPFARGTLAAMLANQMGNGRA
jgi:PAS domain S-box-containing protein